MEERRVTKYLSGILIVVMILLLSLRVEAQNPNIIAPGTQFGPSKGEVAGIIAGVVAGVVVTVIVVVVLVHRHSARARTITGCVSAVTNEITVTNEKDKRVYALCGNTAGVKLGERLTLQGNKINPSGTDLLRWNVSQIQKDYGVCQP